MARSKTTIPPGKACQFRCRRYGVYDLTYEDTPSPPSMLRMCSLMDGFRGVFQKMPYVLKFVVDTMKLAPTTFVVYMMTAIWQGFYSAINLCLLSLLLDNLGKSLMNQRSYLCWPLAISWFLCVMINVAARRMHARSLEVLTKRFRTYFIPQLIRASLRVDPLSAEDLYSIFPVRGQFESEFPGGPFLLQSSQLVERTLRLTSEIFVFLYVILCKQSPERELLLCFFFVRVFIWRLAPRNGIGYSGYIYWPNNQHFKRMKSLFGLAFSSQYRANLVLDGMASPIETEYKRSAEVLGDVDTLDPAPWCTHFLRPWYWDFLFDITWDLPMAVYWLIIPIRLSPSFVASTALLQHATRSISSNMGQYSDDTPSMLDICSHAEQLYDAISYRGKMPQGTEPFPHPTGSNEAGMKISFRHVSLRYLGSDRDALHDVSFDISPGELVLVVGTNGSGKSSMIKLLARLFDPTAGDILINDLPLICYDMDQLRSAMAFQSQTPVVYPVTVRENIGFNLPPAFKEKEHIEEAARMGGCSEWISRLSNGYDTQLKPSLDSDRKWMDGIYGYPSEALKEELARHRGNLVSMSDGEKQRLTAARMFMRTNNHTTRLIVVDEATSSLDPVSERGIITELRTMRMGKTIILVTHRFHHLAQEADRIICMKDGRVVGSGTHAELVDSNGDYCALYQAQVG